MKQTNQSVDITKLRTDLFHFLKHNDADHLKDKLDIIETNDILFPECYIYFSSYYWTKHKLKKASPYIKKYIIDLPNEHKSKVRYLIQDSSSNQSN